MKIPSRQLYDPLSGLVVSESETSSHRIRAKLRDRYGRCFCNLCGEKTEFEIADAKRAVFKKRTKRDAKEVPSPNAISDEARSEVELLVDRYEQAFAGTLGIYEEGRMLMAFTDPITRRGDRSVKEFRKQVEHAAHIDTWARQGDLLGVARLPNQQEGSARPSKLYCEKHNPRRSAEARRAYQRDRKFSAEYSELISVFWGFVAGYMPAWDIETHTYVRKAAYRQLQRMKSPTRLIHELQVNGVTNQSEIARQLGVSRQAVSAAIKRQALKRNPA